MKPEKPIEAGRLRWQFSLFKPLFKDDDLGGKREEWEFIALLQGHIAPHEPRHAFAADRHIQTILYRITLRYRHDIEMGMRLEKDGRYFRILSTFDPDESRRWSICITREEKK